MSIKRFTHFMVGVLATAAAATLLVSDLWWLTDSQSCTANRLCDLLANDTTSSVLFQAYMAAIALLAGIAMAYQSWVSKQSDMRIYFALGLIPAAIFDLVYNLKSYANYHPLYKRIVPDKLAFVLDALCLIVGAYDLVAYLRARRSSSRQGVEQT